MENLEKKTIFSVLVNNNSGVLARIASIFARRGFNIDSLAACPTLDPSITRITIVVTGNAEVVENAAKQIARLQETIQVTKMAEETAVCKELVLLKVHAAHEESCTRVQEIISQYKAKCIAENPESMTIEFTEAPSQIDALVGTLHPFGILEICRTGITAMASA